MVSGSGDRGSTFQREPEVTKDDADSHEAKKYRPTEGTADNFPDASGATCTAIVPVVADSSDAAPARPSDADILDQQNIIRMEEAERRPFVGDLEPLTGLKAEYENGSSVFVQKIETLAQSYGSIRRTRGDGNCFFRSFIFGYLEGILKRGDVGERDVLIGRIQAWKAKLVEAGFQELVFEDAMELLLDQVQAICRPPQALDLDVLVANFRDDTVSNMVVMLLRFIASAEITRRQDHFTPFVLGMHEDVGSVEQFCNRYVQTMGEESDHIHIVALTDALLVPIRVVYLDSTAHPGAMGGAGLEVTTHDFVPEGQEGRAPLVTVLYRPGHYDIVYPL